MFRVNSICSESEKKKTLHFEIIITLSSFLKDSPSVVPALPYIIKPSLFLHFLLDYSGQHIFVFLIHVASLALFYFHSVPRPSHPLPWLYIPSILTTPRGTSSVQNSPLCNLDLTWTKVEFLPATNLYPKIDSPNYIMSLSVAAQARNLHL